MKKMLSFAAVLAALSYASPASAALNIGGDAGLRLRGSFTKDKAVSGAKDNTDDLYLQYRVRLNVAADLGSGYFFKSLLQSEQVPGVWTSLGSSTGTANLERYYLEPSNFYFGRMMKESHYMMGRLPLNSFNNPIFDLALVPTRPVDVPVYINYFDRVMGINYGTKVGSGDLNATLVVLDNAATDNKTGVGNGLFNDGYAVHLTYKTTLGDVTVEPQAVVVLTNAAAAYFTSPNTFGANATIPVSKSKVTLSGFYTINNDTVPTGVTGALPAGTSVKYTGYLLRAKGESGPVMAWVDYNKTSATRPAAVDYTNTFVWAQYKVNVHESASGTFSLTPTLRYRASSSQAVGAAKADQDQLRTELYATVTF